MTQAADLGAVANQTGALYRTRQNQNIQAVVTQHYGASEPPVVYANMIWFSSGDGFIKIRSPTNTSWQNIGTIGPPLTWTNINLPAEGFITGDIKETYNPNQPSGWLLLNDGTIGNQFSGSQSRSNPDCWPLFNLLWVMISDDWAPVYSATTLIRTGRGANALSDWNANRHILLPRRLGRVSAAAGSGAGLSNAALGAWLGNESVALEPQHVPAHAHSFTASLPQHTHGLAGALPTYVGGKSSSSGGFTLADQSSGITETFGISAPSTSAGVTSTIGSNIPHFNVQPTTYALYFIKL